MLHSDSLRTDEVFSNLISRHIFSMLDRETLRTCQLVSKQWCSAKKKYDDRRENNLIHSLENYSSIDMSTLDPKEVSQAIHILLLLFQFPKLLRNSLEKNKYNIFMAFTNPPSDLYNCFANFTILAFEPNEYEMNGRTDDLPWRGILRCLLSTYYPISKLVQKLTAPEHFLKLPSKRFMIVQRFLKASPIILRSWPHFKDLVTWIYYMCESGLLMLQLSENARSLVGDIYLNSPFEIKEQLGNISYLKKKIEDSKEPAAPRKFQDKIEQIEEDISKVKARMKEKDVEILVLKHALQNLQYQMKSLNGRKLS